MLKRYTIVCEKCAAERMVDIMETDTVQRIDWLEDRPGSLQSKIVSGRKRLDGNWGFQCLCGNNDIMTDQEASMIANPAQPKPEELQTIIDNLRIQKPMFRLVEA